MSESNFRCPDSSAAAHSGHSLLELAHLVPEGWQSPATLQTPFQKIRDCPEFIHPLLVSAGWELSPVPPSVWRWPGQSCEWQAPCPWAEQSWHITALGSLLTKTSPPKSLEAFIARSEPWTVRNMVTKAPGFMGWSNRETTCLCLPSTASKKALKQHLWPHKSFVYSNTFLSAKLNHAYEWKPWSGHTFSHKLYYRVPKQDECFSCLPVPAD